MSKQIDILPTEVDMTSPPAMYRLHNIGLFRQLMQRTGTGAPVTFRQLAEDAGVHRNTVNNLLSGSQKLAPERVARALAQRLGVDLLVAFEPVCRSTTTVTEYNALTRAPGEVSA